MMLLLRIFLATQNNNPDCFQDFQGRIVKNGMFFQIELTIIHGQNGNCQLNQNSIIDIDVALRSTQPHVFSMHYDGSAKYSQTTVPLSCQLFYCNELQQFQSPVNGYIDVRHNNESILNQPITIIQYEQQGDLQECFEEILAYVNSSSAHIVDIYYKIKPSVLQQCQVKYRAKLQIYYETGILNYTIDTAEFNHKIGRIQLQADKPHTIYKKSNFIQSFFDVQSPANTPLLGTYVTVTYSYTPKPPMSTTNIIIICVSVTIVVVFTLIVSSYLFQKNRKKVVVTQELEKILQTTPFFMDLVDETEII
ncbi:Hypothetical_protein [Hexamita inflata]|uniref:Hypothetical_protein n=1 Tax=Hexamita inflata TaxID=28002 RepID=A0AA86RBF3_9EUKA|nr:Hypothetical protein HINF_LOCUS57532 [Hexamita inflata]